MAPYETKDDQQVELARLGITVDQLNKLRTACSINKLSADAWIPLVWAVIHLADFERTYKPAIKTEKEQIDSLTTVEMAALSLRAALDDLSSGDMMRLDGVLLGFETIPATNAETLFSHAVTVQRTACATAAAARKVLSELANNGANGLGRKKTLNAYAGHIATLAHQLMPYGIVPADGGQFRRLCDTVFFVAGVPANSQGAITYFKKNIRPDMKQRGLCL